MVDTDNFIHACCAQAAAVEHRTRNLAISSLLRYNIIYSLISKSIRRYCAIDYYT